MSGRTPSLVSEPAVRVTAGLTVVATAAILASGMPALLGLLAADFLLRAVASSRYSPLAAAGRWLSGTDGAARVLDSRWTCLALLVLVVVVTTNLPVPVYKDRIVRGPWRPFLFQLPALVMIVETFLFFRRPRRSLLRGLARWAAAHSGPGGTTIPWAPQRFAAVIGFVLTAAAGALALAGAGPQAEALGGLVLVFCALSSFAGWCAGCRLYALLVRARPVKDDRPTRGPGSTRP
jgi:hypothetical protein